MKLMLKIFKPIFSKSLQNGFRTVVRGRLCVYYLGRPAPVLIFDIQPNQTVIVRRKNTLHRAVSLWHRGFWLERFDDNNEYAAVNPLKPTVAVWVQL